MALFGFPKSERLYKSKAIQELFDKGSSFHFAPFRVLVKRADDQIPAHQVLITVSRRNFKKAVDRNLLKRRIRESYRLNKQKIGDLPKLQIAYIYTADRILEFHQIQEKLIGSFNRLREYVEKS
jgi:ribonuclease P protein component